MDVTTETPGTYAVMAEADYRAVHHFGRVCTNTEAAHFVRATNELNFVAVTNVTASTPHLAVGIGAVTLTAQMTPVTAGQFVYWEVTAGSGSLSTNQGLSVTFTPTPGYGGMTNTITAICGSSAAGANVVTYAVTGVSASPNPAAAGAPVALTATTEPAGCPLPITWNISTNTAAAFTNTFGVGYHEVRASLGLSTQSVTVASVGVKEIQYAVGDGAWTAWTNLVAAGGTNAGLAVGTTLRVRAIPDPEDVEFPAGWPVWGGAASAVGAETTVTFSEASTNASDFKPVIAVCGTSSRTVEALVYRVDSILVATNHVAIGSNGTTVTLTAVMTPATGGEGLVSWNRALGTNEATELGLGAGVEVPCNQAGSFTFTAACGSSSTSTNLNIYQIIGVSASPNLVAAGDPVVLTATTEPGSCPLPLTWNISTNTGATLTNTFAAGYQEVTVTLGDSQASCTVTNVTVDKIQYEASSGVWSNWPSPAYFPKGSSFQVKAIPNPADAQFPANQPVWGGAAGGNGRDGVAWTRRMARAVCRSSLYLRCNR